MAHLEGSHRIIRAHNGHMTRFYGLMAADFDRIRPPPSSNINRLLKIWR
jgi:hypothetical protein